MVKTRSQASTNPPVTDERRSKRKSVATPAGNCDSPDHVLSLQFDSAAATKPVGNKSKSRLSKIPSTRKKSKAPSKPAPEIANLTLPCFIEIFKLCDQRERHHVLPLVCKQWAKILRAPSAAWQRLIIHLSHETEEFFMNPNIAPLPVLSYAKLLKWIKPRAKSITDLTFDYNTIDDAIGESSDVAETTFYAILKAVAPKLETLQIRSDDLGPGFKLRWNIIKKITAAAKTLTTLELNFVDDGNLTSAHVEDIKIFKNLEHLTLKWMPCKDDQHMGERALMQVPTNIDGTTSTASTLPLNLFDLQHLKTLRLNSEGLNGSFPKDLQRLKHLSQFELEDHNIKKLEFLPENLSKLSLRGSTHGPEIMLNGFVEWINEGKGDFLKELDLSHCNLKKLEITEYNELYEPSLGTVEKLDMSYNNFGPLPTMNIIDSMLNLRRLNLRCCGLSVVPASMVLELEQLEFLDLSFNNLVDLPEEVSNMWALKEVYLSKNHFPAIPNVLLKMRTLTHIDLSGCNYLEISKSMSEWLLGMANLVKLDVHKNKNEGRFQDSSILWLKEAVKDLTLVGRGNVLRY